MNLPALDQRGWEHMTVNECNQDALRQREIQLNKAYRTIEQRDREIAELKANTMEGQTT